jgi:SAM-dependent methyltransferase
MAETIAERISRYVLDGSDHDLQRLLRISEVLAEPVRAALRKVGVGEGWRVLDCGCGPLGAMAVMAELVGPTGRVVGIDFSEPTISRARSVLATLGLDRAEALVADVHEVTVEEVGGPFDLAFTRLFLMHQPDPRLTLERIARLLRPGGWLVTQEPLWSPPPRSSPQLAALARAWDLLGQTTVHLGARRSGVEDLPRHATELGLELVEARGDFRLMPPQLGFELHAATTAASKERTVQAGVATGEEIDALVDELRSAKDADYDWVSTPFALDLTLRKPEASPAGEPPAA